MLTEFAEKLQEPASEDLEKESDVMATKLFKEFFPQDGDTITPNDFCKGLRSFARHFADWQKERDFNDFARLKKSWYEEGRIDGKFEGLSDDEKYQQGFHDAKEQMMKGAIEGPFIRRNRYTKKNVLNNFDLTHDVLQNFKDGDKVKVIIIKE